MPSKTKKAFPDNYPIESVRRIVNCDADVLAITKTLKNPYTAADRTTRFVYILLRPKQYPATLSHWNGGLSEYRGPYKTVNLNWRKPRGERIYYRFPGWTYNLTPNKLESIERERE